MPKAIYKNLCPACHGFISSELLSKGSTCSICSKKVNINYLDINRQELIEINNYFTKLLGAEMWSAQRMWAKRILRGQSFSMIAPTGSGKTVFGIIMSIYMAHTRKWKTLFILPTSILVEQVYDKTVSFISKFSLKTNVVAYHTFLSKKEKEKVLSKLQNREGDIIILTSSFILRNIKLVEKYNFNLVFVDDVDGVLKSSKLFYFILKIILNLSKDKIDKIYKELRKGNRGILNEVKVENPKNKVLVVSGASLRGKRTVRIKLLRELLGFEIGSTSESLRNVLDTFLVSENMEQEILFLVKKLGHGGIIFVPQDKGLEYVKNIHRYLEEKGIGSEAYIRPKKGMLARFVKGEVDVLIGIASSRSPLSRGIDLPYTVKYAIFAGVPKLRFILDPENLSPAKKIILLANICDYLSKRDKELCRKLIVDLRKVLSLATAAYRGLELNRRSRKYISELLNRIDNFILTKFNDRSLLNELEKSPYIELSNEKKSLKLIISDPTAYIQASGRTSRLYAGGVSKGLSVVLVDSKKAFNHLRKELTKRYLEIEFKDLNELNINELNEELTKERKIIRNIIEGKIRPGFLNKVKVSLFVVESPNKARTIAWFFGKPSIRKIENLKVYEVHTGDNVLLITSTGGHLFDLVTDRGVYGIEISEDNEIIPVYSTVKKCLRCGESFTDDVNSCPRCGNSNVRDSITIVNSLRKLALEVDRVIIATDPDSEGEKIAWDVYLALKPYIDDIVRAEFHEVTPRAVLNAIRKPRLIDENLVESQILRRIEDRWVGFGLSNIVQRKFSLKTLSAGRVQTPVLGWIIKKYDNYVNKKRYLIILVLENGIKIVKEISVENGHQARKLINKLKNTYVKIKIIKKGVREVQPWPPYTTDSMLKDAANILGLSANETMAIAQDLFENGLITYHRTDSTRVSPLGISIARKYITEHFGKEYYQGRSWSQGSEGAHECIRPTRPVNVEELASLTLSGIVNLPLKLSRRHLALYNLIFKRFIASQMKAAFIERARISFSAGNLSGELEVNVRVLKQGFTRLIPLRVAEIREGEVRITEASYRKGSKEKLFTQGDLIAYMRERGLGRPSTYAKIIETLTKRRYVLCVTKRRVLVPLRTGREVYTYLATNYPNLVSEEKTKKLLEAMDLVSQGKVNYRDVLSEIYKELSTLKVISNN